MMSLHDLEHRRERRERLGWLVLACAVALALLGLSRVPPAGASSSAYVSYCHSSPERYEWCAWNSWMAEGRNQAWFAIDQHFGDSDTLLAQARRVADCESNFEPGAVSPTNDHGVFQINRPTWERRFSEVTGQPWSMVYDAETNVRFARWLWEQSGWQPWACPS